ncbi:MAG: hypothetical protein ACRENP_20665 [Longimicrobiales bacterium]
MVQSHPSWRAFARETGNALRDRLDRIASITSEERQLLARRVEQAIANALEVPPDLKQQIEESAARLIARSVTMDPVAIAWERTRERARRTAAIGAVTTIPAVVPGLGSALAALGLVTDWRFVAQQQRNLVLEIGALFGLWPDDPTQETRNLFLLATATAFAAPGGGRIVTDVLARQIARRGVARLLPGAGAAVAGALNYIATIAIGRAAIEQFGSQAGFEVHGLFPVQAHPAMPWLRNAIVDAMESGRETNLVSPEAARALAELSIGERDELIDLAAALTLARGDDHNRILAWLGDRLGFSANEIDHIVQRSTRCTLPFRERLGSALAGFAERSADHVNSVWRRVERLARRKWANSFNHNNKRPSKRRSRAPRRRS